MAKLDTSGEVLPYGLSERQSDFAVAYVETLKRGRGNATQAAKVSGYGPTSYKAQRNAGSRLMKNPGIRKLIDELHNEFLGSEDLGDLTAEEIIKYLRKEAKTAKSDQARVAAATQLGRTMGLFTDRIEEVKAAPRLCAPIYTHNP